MPFTVGRRVHMSHLPADPALTPGAAFVAIDGFATCVQDVRGHRLCDRAALAKLRLGRTFRRGVPHRASVARYFANDFSASARSLGIAGEFQVITDTSMNGNRCGELRELCDAGNNKGGPDLLHDLWPGMAQLSVSPWRSHDRPRTKASRESRARSIVEAIEVHARSRLSALDCVDEAVGGQHCCHIHGVCIDASGLPSRWHAAVAAQV